jgi:Tol biopolymer transport system component
VDSLGVQHLGGSLTPSVSGDGRYVAFSSTAVLGSPTGGPEQTRGQGRFPMIYLRDTRTGRTTLLGGTAQPPDNGSMTPVVSANGQFVAFVSRAANLVPRDRNKSFDVFLYEVATGAVTLVSRSMSGGTANGASLGPAISDDGRFVAFQSDASDMACARNCPAATDDINLLPDVFIFDRITGQISSVSLDGHGAWLEESGAPAIAGNGAVVAFPSRHPISAGDVLNDFDLFVRILSH